MAIIGYARVSTTDQDEALQVDDLQAAGAERLFIDKASGVSARPELERALDYARSGDVFLVWRLDRLGRSTRDLLQRVDSMRARGIQFRSLREQLDTTTPAGELIFTVLAAVAQFERDINRERTKAGLAAARSRGRVGGRPRLLTPERAELARDLRHQDKTLDEIATTLKVSRATVVRLLRLTPQVVT